MGPKKQAAEWLAKVAEVLDRDAESHEFAYFLVPFANIEEKQSVTKSRLTELFNAFIQAQLQQQQGKENRKNVIVLVIIIVGLLSIVTPTIIILNHRNKLQKQDLETQIEAERHTYQIQQCRIERTEQIKKHYCPTFIFPTPNWCGEIYRRTYLSTHFGRL